MFLRFNFLVFCRFKKKKIISKDGGLVLKDNIEGGATWAYEVGSQSMVCPIIVEDLNPPRQMLVEVIITFLKISSLLNLCCPTTCI